MNTNINDINLDNTSSIIGTIQQLIKLRRLIVEQIPQEDPHTIDTLLQMVIASPNIRVNVNAKPVFVELDPVTLKPLVTQQ